MTSNWFEAKVKYVKVTDEGKEKKVTETYLFDAVSYTEAESRTLESLREMVQGDFYIAGLKKSNITELVESNDGTDDKWYKAKVAIIDADQLTGKEKRANQYFLVAGATIEAALANLQKSLSTYVVPWDIASLAETTIMDVFPYFGDGADDSVPDNLKPLSAADDTAGDVHDRLMQAGAELVVQTVEGLIQHNVETRVQRSFIQGSEVLKPAPKLTRETCRIDWNAQTETVRNLIRGLSPHPAAFTELLREGSEEPLTLKVFRAEKIALSGLPGQILTDGKSYFAIATADGALNLTDLQLSGKKRMDVQTFLRGFKDPDKYTVKTC